MRPKWHELASLAQKICTLWFQFFDAIYIVSADDKSVESDKQYKRTFKKSYVPT